LPHHEERLTTNGEAYEGDTQAVVV
jgi:hypothetical protein